MSSRLSLVGLKFGRLKVIADGPGYTAPCGTHAKTSVCLCDCGNQTIVINSTLRTGSSQSCGCLRRERTSIARTSHGHTKGRYPSPTYYSWVSMWQRCTNPNNKHFKDYGGRGIKICERWRQFGTFLEDMGVRPTGLTIERIENAKGYEPGNCAWETQKVQSRNKRTNRIYTVAGITGCILELCEHFGISFSTVSWRLRRNWSPEHAFTFKPDSGQWYSDRI